MNKEKLKEAIEELRTSSYHLGDDGRRVYSVSDIEPNIIADILEAILEENN